MAEAKLLSFIKKYIHARDHAFCRPAIDDVRACALLEQGGASDVIGMDVRFDRKGKRQTKLFEEFHVALDVFDDGIDHDGFAGLVIGHEVRPALRPVIDILDIVHIKQDSDSVGTSGCDGRPSKTILRNQRQLAAILTGTASLVYRDVRW